MQVFEILQDTDFTRERYHRRSLCDWDEVRLMRLCVAAGREFLPHVTPAIVALCVLEGEGRITSDRETVAAAPGCMVLLDNEEPYAVEADTDMVILAITAPGK